MRTRIIVGILALATTVAVGRLSAQRSGAATGVAPQTSQAGQAAAQAARGGRSGRANFEPTLWLPDDQFLRWPFTDPQYAKIDGFKIKSLINDITAISRKSRDDGNQYWGRIAGTPYDKMTTDWVAAQYKRIGLEQVRVHEFTLPPQWFPTSWDVSVRGRRPHRSDRNRISALCVGRHERASGTRAGLGRHRSACRFHRSRRPRQSRGHLWIP